MTETDWLTSDDPAAMLALFRRTDSYLSTPPFPVLSDRKLRLFACACCRQVWHLLTDERCRKIIEAAERYADDPSAVIRPFHGDAAERFEEMDNAGSMELWQAVLARHASNPDRDFASNLASPFLSPLSLKERADPKQLASLLRDIVGNPFRSVTPLWDRCRWCAGDGLASHEDDERKCWVCGGAGKTPGLIIIGTVLMLARQAYDERPGSLCPDPICRGRGKWTDAAGSTETCERCKTTGHVDVGTLDPFRLAVLADALEEAGCLTVAGRTASQVLAARESAVMGGCCERFADQMACGCLETAEPDGLLEHLRSPGPHVRGCWAIDLLLGRN